jgi:hypothetical protein
VLSFTINNKEEGNQGKSSSKTHRRKDQAKTFFGNENLYKGTVR